MPDEYLTLDLEGGEALVKAESLDQLRRVGAVVFDCDGVLIDVRGSYNRAVSRSVAYIFEALTGCSVPEVLISDEVIYLFRRSGGFNDDWDTVYGVLMFMLCDLPENARFELEKRIEEIGIQPDPLRRISAIREAAGSRGGEELGDEFLEGSIERLKEFTQFLDETGVGSVDLNLAEAGEEAGGLPDFVKRLRCFLCYPGGVGEGIIGTVFEELFCGSALFRDAYGLEPRFHEGPGLIERERSIIRAETLDELAPLIGGAHFGVASGSRLAPARYILKELLERFHPEAAIFLDQVQRAERERSEETGAIANLRKPNPFSLLKAVEALNPPGEVLFVGDSMADAMTVREANMTDARFVFAGVYGHSHPRDVHIRDFIEFGCDVVMPSANDLPAVLEWLRRGKARCG